MTHTTSDKVAIGLRQLKREGLIFPQGVHPLHFPGGNVPINSEQSWNNWHWNPPQLRARYDIKRHPDILKIDFDASDKPTWQEIMDAYARVTGQYAKNQAKANCRSHCRRRITTNAYFSTTGEEELQRRVRLGTSTDDDDTAALTRMDLWREHYRARYRELTWWIDQQGGTLADIELLKSTDWTNDELWENADWIQPGTALSFDDHEGVPAQSIDEHADDPPVRDSE